MGQRREGRRAQELVGRGGGGRESHVHGGGREHEWASGAHGSCCRSVDSLFCSL